MKTETKYTFSSVLYHNKQDNIYIVGFSNPENELAIAVAAWVNRRSFRFYNFIPVDSRTYFHLASHPKKDFIFEYRGIKRPFASVWDFSRWLEIEKIS